MGFFDTLGGVFDSVSGIAGEATDWVGATLSDITTIASSDIAEGLGGIFGSAGGGPSPLLFPPVFDPGVFGPPDFGPDPPPITDLGANPEGDGLFGGSGQVLVLVIAGVLIFALTRK